MFHLKRNAAHPLAQIRAINTSSIQLSAAQPQKAAAEGRTIEPG
jgi:hypothetical protein